MAKLRPISVANFRVTVEGISTYWEKFGGFDESKTTFKFNDGLDNVIQEVSTGMVEKQALTISKSFDPDQDWAIIELFESFCDADGITITVEPINNCKSGERRGTKSFVYYGCQLVGRKGGEADRQGSNSSMLELKFTYERMAGA
jgi:hypothetical protein